MQGITIREINVHAMQARPFEDISGPSAKINFGALPVQSPELPVQVEHKV